MTIALQVILWLSIVAVSDLASSAYLDRRGEGQADRTRVPVMTQLYADHATDESARRAMVIG